MKIIDDATGSIADPDGSTRTVRVFVFDSVGFADPFEFGQMEPCQDKSEGGPPFSQPHQTRPSRSKNKVPWAKRVARRRRRAKLAKAQKKHLKLVQAAKERERAEELLQRIRSRGR